MYWDNTLHGSGNSFANRSQELNADWMRVVYCDFSPWLFTAKMKSVRLTDNKRWIVRIISVRGYIFRKSNVYMYHVYRTQRKFSIQGRRWPEYRSFKINLTCELAALNFQKQKEYVYIVEIISSQTFQDNLLQQVIKDRKLQTFQPSLAVKIAQCEGSGFVTTWRLNLQSGLFYF